MKQHKISVLNFWKSLLQTAEKKKEKKLFPSSLHFQHTT